MDLARSSVNDMYPGINGQNGRILTNDAPFTIPYLNEAFDSLQRELRNEGVKFPIKVVILNNITPVVAPDMNIMPYIGYNGYFDGTRMNAIPKLPSDLMQPYYCWEQTVGTGLQFTPMSQPQSGITSAIQGNFLSIWEWRNYGIYILGSVQPKNLKIRYKSGQPPLDIDPDDFPTTNVNIMDSRSALAWKVAEQYADMRGADSTKCSAKYAKAIDEMALEYVRQSQSQPVRRIPYGGSNNDDNYTGVVGWA